MAWLLLSFGILTEICSSTCMKLSSGFTKLYPSVFTFVFMFISLGIFIFALKHFDLSFAYAIWAGMGILFVSIIGMVYFNEPISSFKIISIIFIVIGVIGLNMSDMLHK